MITGVVLAVILTFNTEPPGRIPETPLFEPVFAPVVIDNWRFTPSLWNAWIQPDTTELDDRPWMYLSPWLGFDDSMVLESNNDSRFDFGGFDSIGLQNGPGVVTSSNGHTLHYVTLRHMARHYEVRWQNVEWVRFDFHDFQHGLGASGFDNIVVTTIDEPTTAMLVGIAGLLLLGCGYKRFFARHY